MNEGELRRLLREAPLPEAAQAEERGARMVAAAFEQRPRVRRSPLPRLAVALAAMTLLGGLLLSSAGAAVRDWIDDVLTEGVPNARPALTAIPSGGRLLVESEEGPWVVQSDGSRRLLGRYDAATWSPHGLFVAAVGSGTLSALEPDGTPHWSISAGSRVADPRWSPSGFRIAYRAGAALRVVAGDGSGDSLLAAGVAPLPPAWHPAGAHLLAYADGRGRIVIRDTDRSAVLASAPALPRLQEVGWSPDGTMLLEASERAVRIREVRVGKVGGVVLTSAPVLPAPTGAVIRDATFAPHGDTVAAVFLRRDAAARPRSDAVLIDAPSGRSKRLFSAPGRLGDLTWSPDGSRLLISWREADQWLFLPVGPGGRTMAIDDIASEFAPGDAGGGRFPRIEGWCCPR